MRAVTWTQVAQYIILIVAYMTPVVWLSWKYTGNPIPQIAYGQVLQKVTEREKVRLYEKLIGALSSEKPQVRHIAILALSIHTGQTKGFEAAGTPAEREKAVATWKKWVAEYAANL